MAVSISSMRMSASRLGIDQFRLDSPPERWLDRAPRNEVHALAQDFLQSLRKSHKAKSNRRLDLHQNVNIALPAPLGSKGIRAEQRQALQRKLRLQRRLRFAQPRQYLFPSGHLL